MKKLIIFALVAMVASFAMAQTLEGIATSYMYDADNDVWYQGSGTGAWATGGAFQGHDFGVVSALTLGGQAATWQGGSPDTTVSMNYEVFQGTTSQGSSSMNLAWLNNTGGEFGNDSTWENVTGVDVAAGLAASTEYTVATWFYAVQTGTPDVEVWDSNGGNNYVASFETAIPEPATMSLLGLGALAMVLRRKIRK
jgi:hypothetical protein